MLSQRALVLLSTCALATVACGQTATLTGVVSDTDLRVRPGQTIRVDFVLGWQPGEVGLGGVFFDIVNEANLDLGVVDISEGNSLGRPPALRVPGQGAGSRSDRDQDGDLDIVGIQAFQQAPAFNLDFVPSNPLSVYSFEWTAPSDRPDGFQVSVSVEVLPPYPTVYVDDFLMAPYAVTTETVTWTVLPPADPRDINGDEMIDQLDLGIVLAGFSTSSGALRYNGGADLDDSGAIDLGDVAYLIESMSSGCPTSTAGVDPGLVRLVEINNTAIGLGADDFAPGFDGGVTHHTFDLRLTVPAGQDWTSASIESELSLPAASFFEHALESEGGYPPLPGFGASPALEFDSYWTGAKELQSGESGAYGGFAFDPTMDPRTRCATWYDLNVVEGSDLSIARFTVVTPEGIGGNVGTIHGVVTTRDIMSDAFSFSLPILIDGACLADLNGDEIVDVADLLAYLDLWFEEDAAAELDGVAGIDVADLLTFLASWFAGCP